MGGKTDLTTANFNLSGAYRLDSNWSFGLGFDAVYAKAKIERYAGDLGQVSQALARCRRRWRAVKIRPTRRSPILMATRGASAGTPGSSMSWIRITATV